MERLSLDELAEVDARIKAEVNRVVSNLESEASVASGRSSSLQSSIGRNEGALQAENAASVRLNDLQRSADAARQIKGLIEESVGRVNSGTTLVDRTPIDYLDFASPISGLGSKMGIDATGKWPGETDREWGSPIAMSKEVKTRIDSLWGELGIG